jgi:DNA-binding response OmpR family regulator/S1-C subfamily serine protease
MLPSPSATRERILVIESDEAVQLALLEQLQAAVYDVYVTPSARQGLEAARLSDVDLVLLATNARDLDWAQVLADLKGAAQTEAIRVIVLAAAEQSERIRALDLGADDAISRPWDDAELLARVRRQLRARRRRGEVERAARLAEEGYQLAQTAFHGLAVTEKMTRDARSLGRMLRRGVLALLVLAVLSFALYFFFWRGVETEHQRTRALIAQLQSGLRSEQALLERTRRAREELERQSGSIEVERSKLESQAAELRAKLNSAAAEEVAALRKQFADTSSRLKRLESERQVAQGIIAKYSKSVSLLHVVIHFRQRSSGLILRYAGINPQGEPLQDSEGNPVLDVRGRGPEVRADYFGTGFLARGDGLILTNRHVVEPWWKSEELAEATENGFDPVIAEMTAYFPGDAEGFRVERSAVSQQADLAVVRGDLGPAKRPALQLDGSAAAATSGQPVVLMGYATGLDAVLARAGEDVVRQVLAVADGNPSRIMSELARRGLIRPLTTQGHIGDVLSDKIVYDAQTASGGSGGPLFNREGKVIGVNFAVVRGFGGSNFGIPARYAEMLLK